MSESDHDQSVDDAKANEAPDVATAARSPQAGASMMGNLSTQIGAKTLQRKIAARAAQRTSAGGAGAAAPGAKAQAASAPSVGGVDLPVLEAFIGQNEGKRYKVYIDSKGHPTVGIGFNLDRGGAAAALAGVGANYAAVRAGTESLTEAQVETLFKQDVASAISEVQTVIGSGTYNGLTEGRKIVVIDMLFNLGEAGFAGFHATIAAIQSGDYSKAASQMQQSAWYGQVGGRAVRDCAIMRSGTLTGVSSGGQSGATGASGNSGASAGGAAGGQGTTYKPAPSLAEVSANKAVIIEGEQGAAVAAVQKLLHVTADGMFGPGTQRAVEQFQRAHKLTVDGKVGSHTLAALEGHTTPGATHSPAPAHPAPVTSTGGVEAPNPRPSPAPAHPSGGVAATGGGGGSAHPAWAAAPSLAEVTAGKAVIKIGEEGTAVVTVQKQLGITADGKFGADTKAAVQGYQHLHKDLRQDGEVDAKTLHDLEKQPVGGVGGESANGEKQRQNLLAKARNNRRPMGHCYEYVEIYIYEAGGYGNIKDPRPGRDPRFNGYEEYAHMFADLMNSKGPATFGLRAVQISNPYQAPAGSIVVVAAGSPGTFNPVAGDISVADGTGKFYNDGLMGYDGEAAWSSGRGHVLGCYVPL